MRLILVLCMLGLTGACQSTNGQRGQDIYSFQKAPAKSKKLRQKKKRRFHAKRLLKQKKRRSKKKVRSTRTRRSKAYTLYRGKSSKQERKLMRHGHRARYGSALSAR